MGLWIQSLASVPQEEEKNYYIYILEYNWPEPLSAELVKLFPRMASWAEAHNSVVMRGGRKHFSDSVFNYHCINGEFDEDILPAIMITTLNPHIFFEEGGSRKYSKLDDKLILIPIRHFAKTTSDIAPVVEKIFQDLNEKKALTEFKVVKEIKKNGANRAMDAIILTPKVGGVGVDLKKAFHYLKSKM